MVAIGAVSRHHLLVRFCRTLSVSPYASRATYTHSHKQTHTHTRTEIEAYRSSSHLFLQVLDLEADDDLPAAAAAEEEEGETSAAAVVGGDIGAEMDPSDSIAVDEQ